MRTRTKVIGSILVALALIAGVIVALGIWFYHGFIDWRSNFPSQLQAGPLLHETKRMHSMGPSGLNKAFVVYALPDTVVAKIEAEGAAFLDAIPMTLAQKMQSRPAENRNLTWEPFDQWTATPVPAEKAWLSVRIRELRKYDDEPWDPSLPLFYGEAPDGRFISLISTDFLKQLHEAIRSPGNFYAYGANRGDCALIVSPSQGRVYFLRR